MASDISKVPFPPDIDARISQIATQTGTTPEEVKLRLMRTFFELVDDKDSQDAPAFVQKVRDALKEVAGAG